MINMAVAFHDFHPEHDDFLQDVLTGLGKSQKEIPAKYFYDERGSALFDQISELEEYYPTRTEIGLLEKYRTEITSALGENCLLVEYGSGSSSKVSILLDVLQTPLAYMPIDICKGYLLHSSSRISALHKNLEVVAICADYMQLTMLPQGNKFENAKKAIFFPGSTIGNYKPMEAIRLLKNALKLVGPGGCMLVGVDLKKDTEILHTAYNDARGITAQFNLNMLERINRELHANFCLAAFSHHAFYNEERGRIEMHLLSLHEQTVSVNDVPIYFRAGESIHTENSYKYTLGEFRAMAEAAGFKTDQVWVDEKQLFSLHYLSAP
ncbi:MAG: L-histidine N(alpha)-methyltransferase [Gammaproteobacteria bacterium]